MKEAIEINMKKNRKIIGNINKEYEQALLLKSTTHPLDSEEEKIYEYYQEVYLKKEFVEKWKKVKCWYKNTKKCYTSVIGTFRSHYSCRECSRKIIIRERRKNFMEVTDFYSTCYFFPHFFYSLSWYLKYSQTNKILWRK